MSCVNSTYMLSNGVYIIYDTQMATCKLHMHLQVIFEKTCTLPPSFPFWTPLLTPLWIPPERYKETCKFKLTQHACYVQYCATAFGFYALVYFHSAQNFTQHIPKFWFTISEEDWQLEQFLQNLPVYQVVNGLHIFSAILVFPLISTNGVLLNTRHNRTPIHINHRGW